MAHLHVKTPGGTTYSIDLDAANSSAGSPSGTNTPNWAYLPNGYMIQFGEHTFTENKIEYNFQMSFPISFSNQALFITHMIFGQTNYEDVFYMSRVQITALTKSNFKIGCACGYLTYHSKSYFMAIGY